MCTSFSNSKEYLFKAKNAFSCIFKPRPRFNWRKHRCSTARNEEKFVLRLSSRSRASPSSGEKKYSSWAPFKADDTVLSRAKSSPRSSALYIKKSIRYRSGNDNRIKVQRGQCRNSISSRLCSPMPVVINNVFSHGKIIYYEDTPPTGQFSTATKFSFHLNTLSLTSPTSFTLSLTKDIEQILLYGNLGRLVKDFLEKELEIDIDEIEIKIVNVNNNTRIDGDQQTILREIIPYIHTNFGFTNVSVTQEPNAPCPVPNSAVLFPPAEFGFISISLSTINRSCYVKFQTDKKKRLIFITLILNSFYQETQDLFDYLDSLQDDCD